MPRHTQNTLQRLKVTEAEHNNNNNKTILSVQCLLIAYIYDEGGSLLRKRGN